MALVPFAMALTAASPTSSFIPVSPPAVFEVPARKPPPASDPSALQAAPVPDQDAFAPTQRASNQATLAPNVFSRRNQWRGSAIDAASSAQSQEDNKVRPGAGFSLRVPLQ